MPIPTPTDERRIADLVARLRRAKASLVVAAVAVSAVAAVCWPCPIHTY